MKKKKKKLYLIHMMEIIRSIYCARLINFAYNTK